jgi:hypothetical protein
MNSDLEEGVEAAMARPSNFSSRKRKTRARVVDDDDDDDEMRPIEQTVVRLSN